VDTPMSHSEYEELAAGYVLGALEPDDEQAFQRHLVGCPICEANLRELEAVAGELAYAAPPVEPPDTLWARIRREIEPEAARPAPVPEAAPEPAPVPAPGWPPPRPAPAPRRRRRGARLLQGLAAAAAILLVAVVSVWNLNLRQENADYRARVAALERATQLANDPNASLVALNDADVPAPPGAQATVIASSRQDRGVLLVENLPPLQRDRVYELWGVPEGDIARAQKALVFVPLRRQGIQTLQFEVPIQPGTAFAITEEPGPDGSDKPTTNPILAGTPPSA
jgi:anti-sigma-K factor RskA